VERCLHRMKLLVARRKTLDGGDGGPMGLHRQDGARLHRFAADQHRTGSAGCGVAPDVGTGESQHFPEED
jgi:hypothetical protein